MTFIKPLFALLGFWLFSIPGAFLGWLAGSMIFTLLTDGPKGFTPQGRQQAHQNRQDIFIETLFTLMGKLAKADSHVSKSEIAHVDSFMTQMKMTSEHRKVAIGYFQKGVKGEFELSVLIDNFQKATRSSLQMKHLMLVYLIGVALSDGQLDPAENTLLEQIAEQLGYSQSAYAQLMTMIQSQNRFGPSGNRSRGAPSRSPTQNLEDAYQALGVNEHDSPKVIKRAYRKLISQYHPDKLMGQGVPEDMINKATERSKEIHTAYDLIEAHLKSKQ